MTDYGPTIISGRWSDGTNWKLVAASQLPAIGVCTSAMCVAIMPNGHIVLARSKRGWGALGGHLEKGESPYQAAVREALEEGGFKIYRSGMFAVCVMTPPKTTSSKPRRVYPPIGLMAWYWATTKDPLVRPKEGSEILERKIFDPRHLPKLNEPDRTAIVHGLRGYRSQ